MKRNLLLLAALGAIVCAVLSACTEHAPSPTVATPPVKLADQVARAKAENKLLVLEFTGSDWCESCILFHKRVLENPAFLTYARSNLIWVEVDFPKHVQLPPETVAANEALTKQFDIDAFPTFVALGHGGKEIWRLPAKDDPSPVLIADPNKFAQLLEAARAKPE